MNRAKIPELKRNHTTLSEYRAVSRRRGFVEGAEIKYYKTLETEKGEAVIRRGVITERCPDFFVARFESGYKESFKYQEILEKRVKVIRRRKE